MIMFFILLLPSGVVVFGDEETEETHDEAKLLSSVKKISITNYISVFGPSEKPDLNFRLINVGQEAAEKIQLIPTSLVMKEESRFSTAPSYISEQNVVVRPDHDVNLEQEAALPVTFTLNRLIDNEGSYEGQLSVIGHNFDPITIDVEVIIKENPWELVLFTLIGTLISASIGYFYTKREKMQEYRHLIDDDAEIISHINGHIRTLNSIRMAVDTHAWKNICEIFEEKKKTIEKYRDELKLSHDAEAVKWFDDMAKMSQLRYFDRPEDRNNEKKPEIEKPNHDDPKYLKKRAEMIKKKWRGDVRTKTKYFFFVGTLLVSLPTTIFASDNFVGYPLLNILIASSLGFTIYRAQDLPKAISKGVEKLSDTEAKPAQSDDQPHKPHNHDH